MPSIFSIIGKSPFGPLARHTERVGETVSIIRRLMELERMELERRSQS